MDVKTCKQCGHLWIPKNLGINPVNCPKCKTIFWNRNKIKDTTKHSKEVKQWQR